MGAGIAQPGVFLGEVHIQRQGVEVAKVAACQADVIQQMRVEGFESLEIALQYPTADHAAQLREGEGTVAGDGLGQDVVAHGCHRLSLLFRLTLLIVPFDCYTVSIQSSTRETLSP
jgi:hypothetical protein